MVPMRPSHLDVVSLVGPFDALRANRRSGLLAEMLTSCPQFGRRMSRAPRQRRYRMSGSRSPNTRERPQRETVPTGINARGLVDRLVVEIGLPSEKGGRHPDEVAASSL